MPLLPATLRWLDARYCAIEQIANFPEDSQLEKLFLSDNRLASVPPLPPRLTSLWVEANRSLSALPEFPATVSHVVASGCSLVELPELGIGLQEANFSDNRIRTLTQRVQPSVMSLNLMHNPISTIPDWMYQLSPQAQVFLSSRHLSDRVRKAASTRADAARTAGHGAQLIFDAPNPGGAPQPNIGVSERTLGAAAGDWRDSAGETQKQKQIWSAFEDEDGAQAFAKFLDRLSKTINHETPATRAPFRRSVQQLLDGMVSSAELREDCFAICVGASLNCEDCVTLSFQQMAVPRLSEAVRRGDFDAKEAMPGLIDRVRSLYRQSVLTEIANRKIANRKIAGVGGYDPTEVHLAYQVGLNKALELQLDTWQMRFPEYSRLTSSDLTAAELEVCQCENEGFANYLINYSTPWSLLMRRRAPDLHDRMMVAKHQAVEPHRLDPAVRDHLAQLGLPEEADALRQAGRVVSDKLTLQAQRPLVEEFLREQGCDLVVLLGPKWLVF